MSESIGSRNEVHDPANAILVCSVVSRVPEKSALARLHGTTTKVQCYTESRVLVLADDGAHTLLSFL